MVDRGGSPRGGLLAYFLHDVQGTQVQLDELFAVLSAVKAGEVSKGEALTTCPFPSLVWVALDPVTKLLLAIEVGDRTLALANAWSIR